MKKMKRVLALLLTLVMLLSVMPTGVLGAGSDTAGVVVAADSVSGKPGDTVTVDLTLKENPGIISLRLKVKYDETVLTLTEKSVVNMFQNVTPSKNITDIPYVLIFDSSTSEANVTATGKLATLTFKINENAEADQIANIEVLVDNVFDFDGAKISASAENGAVSVSEHEWGTPSYQWAADYSTCTGTVSCTCCSSSATKTETVNSTNVHTDADCENAEETVYTAAFIQSPFTTQTKTVTGQAKLGHQWSAVDYKWAEDHSTCTASRSCGRNSAHNQTETVTAKVTTNAASCYATGTKTYTADFDNTNFETKTYQETMPVVGHSWGAAEYQWNADNTACTAKHTCTVSECGVEETVNASNVECVTTPATCEEDGSNVYTATFAAPFVNQKKTVTLPKQEHDWSNVTYTWAEGYGTCTAKRECLRDACDEEETEVKSSTSVTVEPTEDKNGSVTYTVEFDNAAFETQTKVETLYTDPIVVVSAVTAHPDQTVDVTISMKNNPGIVALELNLTYDKTALELTKVADKELIGGFVSSSDETNTNYDKEPFYLGWMQNETCSGNGDLVTLTFKVKKDAAIGEAPVVSVSVKSAIDTEQEDVAFKTRNGSVTVQEHDWSEVAYTWAEDNSTCTASRTCACSAAETEKVDSDVDVTNPTCTENGYTVYTAEFTNPAFTKQQKTVAGEPATKHQWGSPVYTWSDDLTTCTAKHTCTVDGCGEEETETVDVTSETTKATCTVDGKTVYTADFTKDGFEDQTKEETLAASGHSYLVTGSATGSIACLCTVCGTPYSNAGYDGAVTETTPVIVVSDAEGYAGQEVNVTVELKNNPGLAGAVLNLSYDTAILELTKAEDGGLLKDPVFGSDIDQIPYQLTWMDATGGDVTEDGLLATLTFRIKSTASNGAKAKVEVTYKPANLVNADLETVPFAIDNGIVTAKRNSPSIPGGSEKLYVSFRLIGDSNHDDGVENHDEYVTWIPTTRYEITEGNTVYDVFVKAIAEHGLSQKGASGGYVSAVKAPAVLGGYWLSEYDNGPNSGWMYTINGSHVSDALTECELKNGDQIVWHYCDDYKQEEKPTSSYYQRWLEAKDITPEEYVKQNGKDEDKKGETIEFVDVKKSDWFYDEVQYAVSNGLFNGVGNDKFDPNGSMTRAMLVTVLYRLEGEPAVRGTSPFSDVSNNIWYTDAVIWAEDNAIVNGVGDNKFDPNSSITREQMAAVLFRYAQYKKYDTSASNGLSKYSDFSSISAWSLNALKWANAESLITGRTATTLAPKGTATRAEVAAILYRFVENVVNK